MNKLLSIIYASLLLLPATSHAMEDCFPSEGHSMVVLQDTALKSEISFDANVQIGLLLKGERVKITKVKVVSAINIWAQIARTDGQVGWVNFGYFSNIIHGHSPLCFSEIF